MLGEIAGVEKRQSKSKKGAFISQIEFYVKICYTPYAGSEGKAFVGNVMPDKATG